MDKPVYMGLSHINIQTTDMESSIQFYEDNLNFSLTYRTVVESSGSTDGFFPVQYVTLQCGTCVLEVLQPADTSLVKVNVDGIVGHFAIEVENIEPVMRSLKKAGLLAPDATPDEFPGLYNGSRSTTVRGPSGELVELIEIKR